jgi:hypothetical protein
MSRATTPTKSRALKKGQRNKKWPRHPDDWYVEPHWVNERLFAVEQFEGRVWDPAAGLGRILQAAQAVGLPTVGTDIVARAADLYQTVNFLDVPAEPDTTEPNIVCNPPFKLAERFVEHALQLVERKVAMLLPAVWVQGQTRSRWLKKSPLRRVWFLAPRPSMPPGPVIATGEKPGSGIQDFAWFVWLKGYDGHPEIRWLDRDDAITSVHMGPEEKQRHTIKANGKLKPTKGLPLFAKRKTVTRDGVKEARDGAA